MSTFKAKMRKNLFSAGAVGGRQVEVEGRGGQAPKYFGLEPALWTAFFLHCGRDSVELFRGSFADPDLRTESSTTARLFRQHGPRTSETTRRRQDYSSDHGL